MPQSIASHAEDSLPNVQQSQTDQCHCMLHTHNYCRVCCAAAEQQHAALEKPFDLFKAIFENDDDPSSEEEASDTEEPPDGIEPRPAAVPALAVATVPDYQGHQRNASQTEVLTAAKEMQADLSSMQSQQGSAAEASQQCISGTPAELLHQAAAHVQVPVVLHPVEHGSRPSSAKRRKLKGVEKEKSHKKRSKKEKDKKRSGADAA